MSAVWEDNGPWPGRGRRRQGRAQLRWAVVLAAVILSSASGLFGQRLGVGIVPGAGGDNPADFAVVVYNAADPLSRDLAQFYAERRGIDQERVVAITCPITEEISREEYDTTIAGPLRAAFDAHRWWQRTPDRPDKEPSSVVTGTRIRFLVLMRGVPLRIKPTTRYAGDFSNMPSPIKDQNAASVDGELAALGLFTRSISGFVPNPLFRSFARYAENGQPGVLFTGRLDAPTGTMVRRMIEDGLAVEKTGLWGRCYVDARALTAPNPLAVGDEWMGRIASEIGPRVLPTVFDRHEAQFPTAYPMNDAALYFGWYSEQAAGPVTRDDFRFRPGAVACHIHSFSATSVRDPTRWWVAPLLNRGADAVLGNVYEPYLTLTTNLDVFAQRLTDGYTFAESAWLATPGLSWMNTVVGDPLYRPGKVWKDLQFDLGDGPPLGEAALVTEGKAYYQGALVWQNKGAGAGAAALEKSGARLRSGLIYEGLGRLAASGGDMSRGVKAYEQAVKLYRDAGDKVRVTLSEAQTLDKAGQGGRASALLADARKRYAGSAAAEALEQK